jgi:hypothetical protein
MIIKGALTCWLLLLSSPLFIIEQIVILAPLTGCRSRITSNNISGYGILN